MRIMSQNLWNHNETKITEHDHISYKYLKFRADHRHSTAHALAVIPLKPLPLLLGLLLVISTPIVHIPGADAATTLSPNITLNTVLISDIVAMLGPRNQVDFVAVLDRSQGIGKRLFYQTERPLLESLMTQYATVHPDYVRTSVITFAKDVTVVYDHISNASNAVTKCELFDDLPTAIFDDVIFTNNATLAVGTQLNGAFTEALNIFRAGKLIRPNAIQVMISMSDGDYQASEDPTLPIQLLLGAKVNLFALGLGDWLQPGSVRAFASNPFYFGYMADWLNLVGEQITTPTNYYPSSVSSETGPFWTLIPSASCYDGYQTCSATSSCYCDVDRRVRQCLCDAGYQPLSNGIATVSASANDFNLTCEGCPLNFYKSEPGTSPCLQCALGKTTLAIASSNSTQCICNNCIDPCTPDPCPNNSYCSIPTFNSSLAGSQSQYTCTCQPGWTANGTGSATGSSACALVPQCSIQAAAAVCRNGALCYDKPNYVQCICPFGFKGEYCDIVETICAFDQICVNNGTCTSLTDNFYCHCPPGWIGDFCQDVEPSTTPSTTPSSPVVSTPLPMGMSTSNTISALSTSLPIPSSLTTPTTLSAQSSTPTVYVTTPSVFSATPAQLAVNSSSTSNLMTSSTTSVTVSTRSSMMSETTLIIIIVCTVGGALFIALIVIIIVVIVVCVRRSHRHSAERDSAASDEKLHGDVTPPLGASSVGPGTRNLPKSFSNRFSEFWKKGTLRSDGSIGGGVWYENATITTGLPSVPRRRPELMNVSDPSAVALEETILESQHITVDPSGTTSVSLDGWKSYIVEIERSGAVQSAVITKLHSLAFAKTSNWLFSRADVVSLEELMEAKNRTGVTVSVQGVEFLIGSNNGILATGRSVAKVMPSKVIAVGKTKYYMIAAVALEQGDDGKCGKEVEYAISHIAAEGY